MFFGNKIVARANLWRRLFVNNAVLNVVPSQINYSGLACSAQNKYLFDNGYLKSNTNVSYLVPLHRKWYSKGLVEDTNNLTVQHGKVQKNITELFPLPRVTLNELTSKTPSKIFEIHYKQNTVAPKGRKKSTANNDWTCTYAFVWPEKIKFESTAISKRKAAEKAAIQAIHWLYTNKRIDAKGHPIYDKVVLQNIKEELNEPIHITITDKSMERIDKIWKDYESGIKEIYEATFKESKHKVINSPAVLTKDSTIDVEDDYIDEDSVSNAVADTSELKVQVHPVYGRKISSPSASALERRDRALSKKFQQYDEALTPLPIDDFRQQITSTLSKNRVIIIVGAAGCGKSTRAPAAILRECGADARVIVSEPRRVAAMGLAERVASEMGEEVGESIGYQVRLHSKPPKPPGGSILYCTSGVLLRRLQTNPGLQGCSHVIIDEAHERDVNTDITLLLLKKALDLNEALKVVVMSATLDTGVFTSYFNPCPVIEVPGRTFPVEVSYLDDIQKKIGVGLPFTEEVCAKEDGRPQVKCQEVAELIKVIDSKEKEGAILVFLPGWSEIKLTKQLLEEHYGNSPMHMILPVHSRLSTTDQAKMFSTPPQGVRKIVLATNVAETSVTIPDVVYVIDSGAHKENRIKEGTGTASLETVWVSLASAKQRTGRAGRVQPGHCYRMYTKEKEAEFAPHSTPEILRIPLVQTVLDCKSYAPDEKIASFLSQLPEPPSDKSIQFAVNDLIDLGALTPTEQLTRLGSLLSTLTLHPRIGRSVLHSSIIGNVVAATNVAAHCSTHTEVFVSAPERRDEIREIKRKFSPTSDYSALYWIQDEFERLNQEGGRQASDKFCEKYGLRGDRLGFIRSISLLHLEQLLKSSMIAPMTEAEELNRFSDIDELTSGTLLSGADSLLMTRRHVKTKGKLKTVVDVVTSTGDRAHIGSESVNKDVTKRHNVPVLLCYFGGQHSAERRALVAYRTSVVSPHAALLFQAGGVLQNDEGDNSVLSFKKHRFSINVPKSQADKLMKLREMLWKTFDYYIERDVMNIIYEDNEKVKHFKVRLIKTVGRVLVEAHREYVEGKSRIENIEDYG
nr:ATP-dependent RNA helicase DHX30 isoform X1 [Helicoverpa armigera]XP_049706101.1 ATP-dependent RNA helicase DHX30 isoform X1 [Helicoverpa armigera]